MIFISTRGANGLRRRLRRAARACFAASLFRLRSSLFLPCSYWNREGIFPAICASDTRSTVHELVSNIWNYGSFLAEAGMKGVRSFLFFSRYQGNSEPPAQGTRPPPETAPDAAGGRPKEARLRLARFQIHRLDAVGFPPRQKDDPGRLSDDGGGSA